MQIKDLIKPMSSMTDEELLERLRQVRHNREHVRPAARKHVERAEAKQSRAKVSNTDKLVAKLSDAEREALIKQLQEGGHAALYLLGTIFFLTLAVFIWIYL